MRVYLHLPTYRKTRILVGFVMALLVGCVIAPSVWAADGTTQVLDMLDLDQPEHSNDAAKTDRDRPIPLIPATATGVCRQTTNAATP